MGDSVGYEAVHNISSNPAIHLQLPDSSTNVVIKDDSATTKTDKIQAKCNYIAIAGDSGSQSSNLRVSFGGNCKGELHLFRSASPIASEKQFHLALPPVRHSGRSCSGSVSEQFSVGADANNYTDEKALIKSLELLADALGFKKSFSTSDILGIGFDKNDGCCTSGENQVQKLLQRSQSDMQLSDAAPLARIEASSRSLSTWVAVGDTSATTQLPSPQVKIKQKIRRF